MNRQLYVNLPVGDLERSKAFFGALGFGFEPKFTDENAACMIVGDNVHVMLLAERFFRTFTRKALCDARTSTEVLVALSCESRGEVDRLVEQALAAGGRIAHDPEDHGFMYERAFEDLDGHIWEAFYMEPDAAPAGQPVAPAPDLAS